MNTHSDTSIDFRKNTIKALQDDDLRENFRGAMHYLREKRSGHFSNDASFKKLQHHCEKIKQRALANLPDLLILLEEKLTDNGIKVHWAESSEEANQIILDICRQHGAKKVVKGKSMVTEEIGLNHAMEDQGIEAIETDMGEFIVQLAEETPSHIIMPAIHKTKEEIAHLFKEKFPEIPYSDNVDELIQLGRKILREKFEQADIGISGVNFAVAETGTLVLVENEGNGRMSTTVPPVHIAVTGIEKVVESIQDIPALLHLLTRSATGQIITTYVNMISSPRKSNEKDGPEEVHLVLLDNGRSQAYQDELMRKSLQCIRCGACMNHCPIYGRVGGHAYQTVYPGPIGKIISPHMQGLEKTKDFPSASSLCGACEEVCPVGIPIPEILRYWRELGVNDSADQDKSFHPQGVGANKNKREHFVWKIWALMNSSPWIYQRFLKLTTRIRHLLPLGISEWSKHRSKPTIAKESLHEAMAKRGRSSKGTEIND